MPRQHLTPVDAIWRIEEAIVKEARAQAKFGAVDGISYDLATAVWREIEAIAKERPKPSPLASPLRCDVEPATGPVEGGPR